MIPRNTSVGPRSKRAVTANPSLMQRPNVAAKGLKPAGPAQGMLNGRSVSSNVVNRYLAFLLFLFLLFVSLVRSRIRRNSYNYHFSFVTFLFSSADASPPVPRPRSTSTRSADDVSNDTRVTNGSNRLSADLDNYAQVKYMLYFQGGESCSSVRNIQGLNCTSFAM